MFVVIKVIVKTCNHLIFFLFSFVFGDPNRALTCEGEMMSQPKKGPRILPDQFEKPQSLLYYLNKCRLNI